MERVLSAVMEAPAAAGGESLLGSIKIAVLPIAKVFTMCFLGFLMASKWFIPVNVVLGAISGSLIGFVIVTFVKPPYPYFKFSIIQIGIGNIGNVPLVLIAALCRDTSNPFGDTETCSTQGTAYISFGQWVGAIILYTYVFHMFAPPAEGTFDLEDVNLPLKNPPKDASPEQVPLLMQEAAVTDSDNSEKGKFSSCGVGMSRCVVSVLVFSMEHKVSTGQVEKDQETILAMVLGAVPVLKRLIFTTDAPLYFFTDSCIILGEAMIPCILLALGGNLVDGPGPGSSRIGLRTLVAIIIGRLCLVPPAGLGIVTLADKLGFLPANDKMFRFVLLLQHTMPTSVLSGRT
ncbi:hypothetical protein SCA6_016936 [Theobroma cacao]